MPLGQEGEVLAGEPGSELTASTLADCGPFPAQCSASSRKSSEARVRGMSVLVAGLTSLGLQLPSRPSVRLSMRITGTANGIWTAGAAVLALRDLGTIPCLLYQQIKTRDSTHNTRQADYRHACTCEYIALYRDRGSKTRWY